MRAVRVEEWIVEDLICLDGAAESAAEAIALLGKLLESKSYVSAAYTESVQERERSFPTGLALGNFGIAIPHATPEGNVWKNGIAALRLKKPTAFRSMEDPEETVEAALVFLLALKDSGQHLEMLQKLFGMFQTSEAMQALRTTTDARAFRRIVAQHLSKAEASGT